MNGTRHRAGPGSPLRVTAGVGLLLLLVPVVALLVTNRDPDPLFRRSWWTPIASVPTETLAVGTLGLALLLATAVAAAITLPFRRRRLSRLVGLGLALVLTVGAAGAVAASSAAHADTSAAAIRAVLAGATPPDPVSAEATRAFGLALGEPVEPTDGIRVVHRATVPAGPWLVQTTEVLNPKLGDEHAEVVVGTLVDPIDGGIEAAWFSGL